MSMLIKELVFEIVEQLLSQNEEIEEAFAHVGPAIRGSLYKLKLKRRAARIKAIRNRKPATPVTSANPTAPTKKPVKKVLHQHDDHVHFKKSKAFKPFEAGYNVRRGGPERHPTTAHVVHQPYRFYGARYRQY